MQQQEQHVAFEQVLKGGRQTLTGQLRKPHHRQQLDTQDTQAAQAGSPALCAGAPVDDAEGVVVVQVCNAACTVQRQLHRASDAGALLHTAAAAPAPKHHVQHMFQRQAGHVRVQSERGAYTHARATGPVAA